MYSPNKVLPCPQDFDFPFTPYDIQQQLMQELYQVLENKQIGVFESPTGTGKSLTLTCAALKWLEDHEELVRKELLQRLHDVQKEVMKLETESQAVTDWLTMHSKTSEQRKELLELKELKKELDGFEEKLSEIRSKQKLLKQSRSKNAKVKQTEETEDPNLEEDVNVLLDDSNSAETEENLDIEERREKYRDVQIFFCSRTHTQLSQVVKEIKRTSYGQRVRCVSLASRQQLCIHKHLRKINNTAQINEKCLDMAKVAKSNAKTTYCDLDGCAQKKARITQKTGANELTNCSFKTSTLVQELSELSLVDILDIEDLVTEGEQLQACPYYAARNATQLAQIIMMPYQLLLHKRTRQQSGINLKGSIIIIDEAHNLLDTISQMHSCELSLQQLQTSHQQILAYKMKYSSRFSISNLLSINQLLFVIKRLIILLNPSNDTKDDKTSSRILCTYEIMSEGDFFNIDLYQLLQFCEKSRFAQKLQGFGKRLAAQPNPNENQPPASGKSAAIGLLQRLQKDHIEKQQNKTGKNKLEEIVTHTEMQENMKDKNSFSVTSPIRPLLSFLEALCQNADDGRILINVADKSLKNYESQAGFKYILLNPGAHFQDIVKDARAIIVAGGTMQPTAELTEQLFNSCPERVQLRFYDHVVPDDAVLPFVVTKGPRGRNLCFNYAQRSSAEMLSDLCTVLENLCNVIPAGLVCFLPSYDYLDTVYGHLQKSGVLQRISNKKQVFKEPRNIATAESGRRGESPQTVEQLLGDYANAIKHNKGGALLLSVVGAKLSEGLNFADDLGRGVIVVGMPYPNRDSPELKERMAYLDSTLGLGSGAQYYENLCMKAVNQCIGRSVRHIKDYACVYLLDERYARENIRRKLPQWISRHLQIATTYGKVQAGTAKFFKQKK